MYWQSWFTNNEMSGLVNVQYWRAPTTWRYLVGSSSGPPSNCDSLLPVETSDLEGLTPNI